MGEDHTSEMDVSLQGELGSLVGSRAVRAIVCQLLQPGVTPFPAHAHKRQSIESLNQIETTQRAASKAHPLRRLMMCTKRRLHVVMINRCPLNTWSREKQNLKYEHTLERKAR